MHRVVATAALLALAGLPGVLGYPSESLLNCHKDYSSKDPGFYIMAAPPLDEGRKALTLLLDGTVPVTSFCPSNKYTLEGHDMEGGQVAWVKGAAKFADVGVTEAKCTAARERMLATPKAQRWELWDAPKCDPETSCRDPALGTLAPTCFRPHPKGEEEEFPTVIGCASRRAWSKGSHSFSVGVKFTGADDGPVTFQAVYASTERRYPQVRRTAALTVQYHCDGESWEQRQRHVTHITGHKRRELEETGNCGGGGGSGGSGGGGGADCDPCEDYNDDQGACEAADITIPARSLFHVQCQYDSSSGSCSNALVCATHICQNGGTPHLDSSSGACACECSRTGYEGPACDEAAPCQSEDPTIQANYVDCNVAYPGNAASGVAGACGCACGEDWGGSYCEQALTCTALENPDDPSDDGCCGIQSCSGAESSELGVVAVTDGESTSTESPETMFRWGNYITDSGGDADTDSCTCVTEAPTPAPVEAGDAPRRLISLPTPQECAERIANCSSESGQNPARCQARCEADDGLCRFTLGQFQASFTRQVTFDDDYRPDETSKVSAESVSSCKTLRVHGMQVRSLPPENIPECRVEYIIEDLPCEGTLDPELAGEAGAGQPFYGSWRPCTQSLLDAS